MTCTEYCGSDQPISRMSEKSFSKSISGLNQSVTLFHDLDPNSIDSENMKKKSTQTHTFTHTYRKTSDRSPWLLSVQVIQTPGLYAGPGVYPWPGLYHNMSSLCYFIQKKIVNFHVYRVPVFCLFSHYNIAYWEGAKEGYKVYYIS